MRCVLTKPPKLSYATPGPRKDYTGSVLLVLGIVFGIMFVFATFILFLICGM